MGIHGGAAERERGSGCHARGGPLLLRVRPGRGSRRRGDPWADRAGHQVRGAPRAHRRRRPARATRRRADRPARRHLRHPAQASRRPRRQHAARGPRALRRQRARRGHHPREPQPADGGAHRGADRLHRLRQPLRGQGGPGRRRPRGDASAADGGVISHATLRPAPRSVQVTGTGDPTTGSGRAAVAPGHPPAGRAAISVRVEPSMDGTALATPVPDRGATRRQRSRPCTTRTGAPAARGSARPTRGSTSCCAPAPTSSPGCGSSTRRTPTGSSSPPARPGS